MQLIKVSSSKYINVDLMTQALVDKKGRVIIYYLSGSADMHGWMHVKLDVEESQVFLRWLDQHSRTVD